MRFLLDQSVEARVATFLSEQGHDVTRVGGDYPQGLSDAEVLALANTEGRILLTNDRDFGELVFRQRRLHAGVIYFRFPLDSTVQQKIASLQRLLASHADRLGEFIVVAPRGVRVRRSRRESIG